MRKTNGFVASGLACALIAFGMSVTPARARGKQADRSKQGKPPGKNAEAKRGKPGAAGMVVAKDPVTGQLRMPDAQEMQQLQLAGPSLTTGGQAPAVVIRPNGVRSVMLDESFMVHSVVTRNADGTLTMSCVTGKDAAEKPKQGAVVKKEALDVR